MAHSSSHNRRASRKRHSWPRTRVDQLETIFESPPAHQKAFFGTETQSQGRKPRAKDAAAPQDSEQCRRIDMNDVLPEAIQAQMIWYSHHLEESHHDRERLSTKVKELERVCRSQSKTNAMLLQDIQSWQHNYETIESELIEVAKVVEEAKTYVRTIETANTGLRYALEQAREEQEAARRREWRYLAWRCWQSCAHFPSKLIQGFRRSDTTKPGKLGPRTAARPESMFPILEPSTSIVDLPRSGACSRMSGSFSEEHQCSSVPDLPVKHNEGTG